MKILLGAAAPLITWAAQSVSLFTSICMYLHASCKYKYLKSSDDFTCFQSIHNPKDWERDGGVLVPCASIASVLMQRRAMNRAPPRQQEGLLKGRP